MPEQPFELRSQGFAGNGCSLSGSHIGSKEQAIRMLKLAAEKKIEGWIEVMP